MLIGEADFQKIPKIFDTLPLHTSPSSFLFLPLLLPLLPPQKEEEEVYMGTQKIQKFQKFGQIPKWEFRKSLPAPVGFDFTPRSRWERENPGGSRSRRKP